MRTITNKNLGPKYGVKLRKQYIKYYNMAHERYRCNVCNFDQKTIRRQAAGIWYCNKCDVKFVGYAYHPYLDL